MKTPGFKNSRLPISKSSMAYKLRLFITGATPNSVKALTNIKLICESYLRGKYLLDIIDLYDKKYLAEQENVVAVPMLVIDCPSPTRKFLGDFSDQAKVLAALGLTS
jgi:circadian clock protein KaiB